MFPFVLELTDQDFRTIVKIFIEKKKLLAKDLQIVSYNIDIPLNPALSQKDHAIHLGKELFRLGYVKNVAKPVSSKDDEVTFRDWKVKINQLGI